MAIVDYNNPNDKPPIDYDQSKVPQEIKDRSDGVRHAKYGSQNKEFLAQNSEIAGIYAGEAKKISEDTKQRQDNLEVRFDAIQQDSTGKDVVSSMEIVAARGGKATLGQRLDEMARKGSGVSTGLSLNNGWVGTVRWRKSDGDVVTIEVDVAKNSTITPLNDIVTLPANIRTFEKVLPVVSTTTGDIEFLYINAGGVLRTPAKTTMQTGRSYHGVITYTI